MPIDALGQTLWTTGQAPYTGARVVTPGTPVNGGRGVLMACSVAGNVRLKMQDGLPLNVPMAAGQLIVLDNFSVTDVIAAGTTATAVVSVLL